MSTSVISGSAPHFGVLVLPKFEAPKKKGKNLPIPVNQLPISQPPPTQQPAAPIQATPITPSVTPPATPPQLEMYSIEQAFEFGIGVSGRTLAVAGHINSLVKFIMYGARDTKIPTAMSTTVKVFAALKMGAVVVSAPWNIYNIVTHVVKLIKAVKARETENIFDQSFGIIGDTSNLLDIAPSIGSFLRVYSFVSESHLEWLGPLNIVSTALSSIAVVRWGATTYLAYKVQKAFNECINNPALDKEKKLEEARKYLDGMTDHTVRKYFKSDIGTIKAALIEIDRIAEIAKNTTPVPGKPDPDIREEALKLLSRKLKITTVSFGFQTAISMTSLTLSALSFIPSPVMPCILLPLGLTTGVATWGKHLVDDHYRKAFARDLHTLAYGQAAPTPTPTP